MPAAQMAIAVTAMAIFFLDFLASAGFFGALPVETAGLALTFTTVPGERVRPQEGQESEFLTTAVVEMGSSKNFLSLEKCLPQSGQQYGLSPVCTSFCLYTRVHFHSYSTRLPILMSNVTCLNSEATCALLLLLYNV